jgi:hypothetical protein
MSIRSALSNSLCVLALAAGMAQPARADLITLRSGGEIRGELQGDGRSKTGGGLVSIRTMSGATVSVVSDDVQAVVRRRMIVEEYESRRRAIPDTLDAHWELAEWCRQNSLSKEREGHLRRVVELDEGHLAAHRALGHVRHNGKWMTHDQMMTSRGYVKYKGRYVLPQELELIQQDLRVSEAEKAWFRRVRMWHGWLDGERGERQSEGLALLRGIKDADAVPALAKSFRAVSNEEQRLIYVEILSHIGGEKPLQPLIMQSLWDESLQVREASINGVRKNDVDKALPFYLRALKNGLNMVVNRAGTALGQLGNETAVPHLIDALVTRHSYTMLVPDSPTGIRSDGVMTDPTQPVLPPSVELMMAAGQLPYGVQVQQWSPTPGRVKEIPVEKDEENPAVLDALTLLTGQNLGYDESAWRKWYNAQHNLKRFPSTSPRKSKARQIK